MAPSLALLGVPSRSSIVWSTRRWSSASRPSSAGPICLDHAVDGLAARPCRRSARRRRAARPPRTRRWRRRSGTAARANVPSSRSTSTSTVGLPRESRISRAPTASMIAMRLRLATPPRPNRAAPARRTTARSPAGGSGRGALEGTPVGGRSDAQPPRQVEAQVGSGAEPAALGDLVDPEVGALEQPAGLVERAGSPASAADVVPVSARKRRANVRGAQPACRARSSTVSGSASRPSIHSQVAASPSPAGGSGRVRNWAWPPSRYGATTIRRATAGGGLDPVVLRGPHGCTGRCRPRAPRSSAPGRRRRTARRGSTATSG